MNKIFGVTVGTPQKPLDAANALKGKASSANVVLKDVSPFPHEIKVKIATSEELVRITDIDWSSWSKDGEYGDYIVAEKSTDSDLGEGKLIFEDGSELDIGMSFDITFYELNVGDVVRFIDEEDGGYWEAYLVRGFSGDPTTVNVTVSGVLEYIDLSNSEAFGDSCFESSDYEFIVESVKIYDDGWGMIYFTNGTSCTAYFDNGLEVQVGDRAEIHRVYNDAYGYDVATIQLVKGEYKEPVEYTPNDDGTVTGIICDGTPITISNDKGAILEVEYNRDLNKVLTELIEKVENM